MLRVLFWSTLFLMAVGLQAQVPPTAKDSSAKNLQEVIVQAYGSNSSSFSVPASIGSVSRSDLQRYSVFNLLPSFNGVSGVRLEERSPGSYRLSIRGSLLRSPFGVRNVKIYYDDFLLTDAGGNTYLNLLDVAAIGKAEIIKGPAGSNYGAGTGGAVLLSSTVPEEADTSTWKVRVGGGSFSTLQESVHYQSRSNGMEWGLTQSHFQSKGYRDHSG
ncbi:MAG: TonB-dependent receptor plug domain-containing protein, partial [Bacteroidota bacterium]